MRRLILLTAVVSLLGCSQTATDGDEAAHVPKTKLILGAAEPDDRNGTPPDLYAKTPVTKQDVGQANVLPPPNPRTRVRMNVDQLQATIKSVLGGVEWVDPQGQNKWLPYYSALGVPDYMGNVMEIIEPTISFDKLLGDAARDLCPVLLAKEKTLPIGERVFLTKVEPADTLETQPDGVKENLSVLLLRFHGRFFPADDPRLTPWVDLFANVVNVSGDTETAWTAVCVGLMSHPEFSSR